MTGEPGPPAVRKFSIPLSVSAADLADAQEMREHDRRLAAMTPEERAERRARQDAERAVALASAVADWRVVRDRLAGNGPALAALKIHRPADSGSFAGVVCAQREGSDDPDEWPCETFTAIKEA
jgi:hypothetical protein